MTRKTVKALDAEVSQLKEEFKSLKSKFDELTKNNDNLKKEHEHCKKERKIELKCKDCEVVFSKERDLQQHRKCNHPNSKPLQCDQCEKMFDAEWKLNAHVKVHKKNYPCNVCSKISKCEDVKTKHLLVAHESQKLYCTFYNNKKVCLYDRECVFLHEDAPMCKYGGLCERKTACSNMKTRKKVMFMIQLMMIIKMKMRQVILKVMRIMRINLIEHLIIPLNLTAANLTLNLK